MDGDPFPDPGHRRSPALAEETDFPKPHPDAGTIRILWPCGLPLERGARTELRLLSARLDRTRYRIELLPLPRKDAADHSPRQWRDLGVPVDTTVGDLSAEAQVHYLRRKLSGADVVVVGPNAAGLRPALEGMALRPPLIGPSHRIPPMVDLSDLDPAARAAARAALGVRPDELLVGGIASRRDGREARDFILAAAEVARNHPHLRFLIVLDPDASEPDLHRQAIESGLGDRLILAGEGPAMAAMDIVCRLSPGEGRAHGIAEAGGAGLPVIATPDARALHLIHPERTGLIVPPDSPGAVAVALRRLAADGALRRRLGAALRAHVHATCAPERVVPQWQRLFDSLVTTARPAPPPATFASAVMGGWECSTHRLPGGRRLDPLAAIGHDIHAAGDYRQLAGLGIRSCRDGLRWHRIETAPGRLDFASWTPMLDAARATGTQVIWDLMHYGWPEGLDIWSPAFVDRFASFARAAGRHLGERTDAVPFWCPVNEISFFAWAGGDVGYLNPFATGRGFELKVQLARAALAAMIELRAIDGRARFVHAEPLIAIHHDPDTGRPAPEAQGCHEAQFQALDLLSGRLWPQIGGAPEFLDLVGVNYYVNNQWIHGGPGIDMDHPSYAPLSDLLHAVAARYDRPLLVAETGIEGGRRADWFRYVRAEVERARRRGVRVEGICLYPVADHPGWDNDRLCPNGLLGHEVRAGRRALHEPLARLLDRPKE